MTSERQTTHAQSHPERTVQETRGRKKTGKLSDAEKATRRLATAARKAAQDVLAADLDIFTSKREDTIVDLATKHGKTEDYIRSLLMSESRFVQTRAPTLRNGLIHELAAQAKMDGITLHLQELQAIADVRLATEEFSSDEEDAYIAAVMEHRGHKTKGLRATNTANAVDSRSVADNVQDEITHLQQHTGTLAFGFFTRGDLDDPSMPTFVSSGNAADFCLQVLKTPALDIPRRFERWVIDNNRGTFVGDDTAKMAYVHFKVDVALAWKLKLMGWPLHIPFANPSQIGLIDNLRRIRDDIRAGLIYFEALSPLEARALQTEVDGIAEAQGGRTKRRKTRKDKGQTHAPAAPRQAAPRQAEDSDDEEEGGLDRDGDDDEDNGDCLGDNDVERDARTDADAAITNTLARADAAANGVVGNTGTDPRVVPFSTTNTLARADAATNGAVGNTGADPRVVPFSTTNTLARADAATNGTVGNTGADPVLSPSAPPTPSHTPMVAPSSPSSPSAPPCKPKQQGGGTTKKARTESGTGDAAVKVRQTARAARGRGAAQGRGGRGGALGGRGAKGAGGSEGGMGQRDDATTQAVMARMELRSAAVRSAVALASQLPPSA
ncbi:hypothetical protein B0H14DRAFT_2616791 [Mycena olivaceomarginata]|nr:hypothetical protein B0H14DRAFT_2616791 [Mycena olivaceomarginata]